MKLRAFYKYQLQCYKWPVAIFYVIFIMILEISIISGEISSLRGTIESSTAIFLFVCGLNSFKEDFLFGIQNGVSRKTYLKGVCITNLTVAFGMAIIGQILGLALSQGNKLFSTIVIDGVGIKTQPLTSVVYAFAIYAVFITVGTFITVLYYRMNKMLKIIVSVGVPACTFFIIPMIDVTITNGNIGRFIERSLMFILGIGSVYKPYNLLISCFLGFVILIILSWCLVKKSPVKK